MINIIGDQATYHTQYDAQLQSDIETVARNCSAWVRTSESTEQLAADAAEAVEVATGPVAQISTLILPADVSWGEGGTAVDAPPAIKMITVTSRSSLTVVLSRMNWRRVQLALAQPALPGLKSAVR